MKERTTIKEQPLSLADMSDDELWSEEERLYDLEVEGYDVWFERDQILWEINRRNLK